MVNKESQIVRFKHLKDQASNTAALVLLVPATVAYLRALKTHVRVRSDNRFYFGEVKPDVSIQDAVTRDNNWVGVVEDRGVAQLTIFSKSNPSVRDDFLIKDHILDTEVKMGRGVSLTETARGVTSSIIAYRGRFRVRNKERAEKLGKTTVFVKHIPSKSQNR